MRAWRAGLVIVAVAAVPGAGTLTAQERIEETDLPRAVAEEVVAFFNDSSTIRFTGRSGVPAGGSVIGDVAVLGGEFVLGGRVDGSLVVVNGDLVFREGGAVTGDVVVVGGRVLDAELGSITGGLAVYDARLRYLQRGERIAFAGTSRVTREDEGFSSDFGFGRSRLTVRSGTSYNRVEGLPVQMGPIIETGGSNPLRFEALAVWRSDSGLELDPDEMGYFLRLEQRIGGPRGGWIGATAFSEFQPVERWGLKDIESSLATFLLHKDYRDYYEGTGWSAYARWSEGEIDLEAEYRDEDFAFAPVVGPWSLTRNDEEWRPQPLVAEGRLRSVGATLTLDDRNDPEEPSDGWFARIRARTGVGGTLAVPSYEIPAGATGPGEVVAAREIDTGFATGLADLRRYARVGPSSAIALRAVLGGSLDGAGLPPQYQHAPGGEGSLPGFPLFSVDCGARDRHVLLPDGDGADDRSVFPAYGCDRMAVFQAEYRGELFFDVDLWPDDEEEDWEDDWGWGALFEFTPRWSVFFDAGRGWAIDVGDGLVRRDEDTRMDVGLGLFLGDLGLYWALPLTGNDRNANFFVRLGRRF